MSFEPIAEAAVRIIPDFSSFDAAVLTSTTETTKAIEATFAKSFKKISVEGGKALQGLFAGFLGEGSAALDALTADSSAAFKAIADSSVQGLNVAISQFQDMGNVALAELADIRAGFQTLSATGADSATVIAESLKAAGLEAQTSFAALVDAATADFEAIAAEAAASASAVNASFAKVKGPAIASTGAVAAAGTTTTNTTQTVISATGAEQAAASTEAFATAVTDVNSQLTLFNSLEEAATAQLALFSEATVAEITTTNILAGAVAEAVVALNAEGVAAGTAAAGLEVLDAANKKAALSLAETSKAGFGLIGQLGKLAPVAALAFSVATFSDFQKAAKAATAAFGDDVGAQVKTFAEDLPKAFGISQAAALKLTTSLGNALVTAGFTEERAASISENLIRRAGDFGAASGKGLNQTVQAFTTALEGQGRGLKALGINITTFDQKQESLRLGFGDQVQNLNDAQRALVTYNLILDKTDQFEGQASKTSGDLAGQFRIFKAEAVDLGKKIGENLAPAIQFVFTIFNDLIKVITLIPGPILAVAAAIGTLAVAISALKKIEAISTLFTGIASAAKGAVAGISEFGLAASAGVLGLAAIIPVALLIESHFIDLGNQTLSLKDKIKALSDEGVDSADRLRKAFDNVDLPAVGGDPSSFGGGLDAQGGEVAPNTPAQDAFQVTEARKQATKAIHEFVAAGKSAAVQAAINSSDESQATKDSLNEILKAENAKVAAVKAANGELTDEAKTQLDNINALFAAQGTLEKANISLTKSNRSLGDAQKRVNDLLKEGGAKELAADKQKLADATESVASALERQKDAQKALNDVKAVDIDRLLSDAADDVTSANIALARAIRAREVAQKALNATDAAGQGGALNLAGKSIAQIKEIVANARATAQAASENAKTTAVDPATARVVLVENLAEAEISVRKAQESQTDALKAQGEVRSKQLEAELSAQRTLDAATTALTKSKQAQIDAQDTINKFLAGESQFTKDLAAAQSSLTSAKEAQASAAEAAATAQAKETDALNAALGIHKSISAEQLLQFSQNGKLIAQSPELQKAILAAYGPILLAQKQAQGLQLPAGVIGPGNGLLGVNLTASQKAITDFNAPANLDAIRQLLRDAGLPVLFAQGGIAHSATLGIFGEAGREGLIPFTKPQRAAQLLASDPAWGDIQQRIDAILGNQPSALSLSMSLPRPAMALAAAGGNDEEILTLLRQIAKNSTGGVTVESGAVQIQPAAGTDETLLARRAVQMLERKLGRL